jgi:hypothetical protein
MPQLPTFPQTKGFHFTHRWVVWLRPNFPRGYKLISEGDTVLLNGKRVPLLSPTDWQTFIGLLMLKRWRERYLKSETKKENDSVSTQRNNMGQPGPSDDETIKWG